MRKIILLSFIILISVSAFSQNDSVKVIDQTKIETHMLGLRTTIYKVGNIQEAKEWYSKAFGAKPYFDESFYIGFNIQGYELGLLPEKNPTTNKAESVLTYWGVNNIEKEYKRLINLGATEHEKPVNVGGELMTATVKDPWGNIIGLIYNPEFKLPE